MSGSRRIFATADCNLATIVGGTPAQDCSPRTVATSKTLVAELVAGRHLGQRFVTLQDADAERAQLAGFDQRNDVGNSGLAGVDLAGQ